MQIKLMLLLLLLTTGLVTNFSGCITKDSFPSIPPAIAQIHRIFNVQRKEETKNLVWCWLQCQGSVKHLTSISYNAGKITV